MTTSGPHPADVDERLAARAARRVLDDGAVPTYLAPGNTASAGIADARGFPDVGWTISGRFPAEPD